MTPTQYLRTLTSLTGTATEDALDEAHQLVCDLARRLRRGERGVKLIAAYDDALARYVRRAAKLTKGKS